MIKFKCEYCGKKMGVKDEYAGKKAKCPGCASPIRVPEPETDYELNLDSLDAGEGQGKLVSVAEPAPAAAKPPPDDYGFTVSPGRLDDESKTARAASAASGLVKALAISAVVAAVAGSLWAGVAVATGYEFSFLAILIGVAVGGTCAFVAKQQSPVVGLYAAGLTVAGILLGKVLIFNYFVPTTMLDLIETVADYTLDDEFYLTGAVTDSMRENGEFDADVQAFLVDMEEGDAWEKYSDRQWEALSRKQERQVEARIATLEDAEKTQLIEAYKVRQDQQVREMNARFVVEERMAENNEFSPEVMAFFNGDIDDMSDENLDRLAEQQEAEVDAEMAKLGDAELAQLAEAYDDEFMGGLSGLADGVSTFEKIKMLTSWTDLIFFFFAVSAAFKVGSGGWLDT